MFGQNGMLPGGTEGIPGMQGGSFGSMPQGGSFGSMPSAPQGGMSFPGIGTAASV